MTLHWITYAKLGMPPGQYDPVKRVHPDRVYAMRALLIAWMGD